MNWLKSYKEIQEKINEIKVTSIEQAVASESGVLALFVVVDQMTAVNILTIMINDVLDFLNLTNTMDARQVLQTVDLILKDNTARNFKPEDFKLCFDNGKKGLYGEIFNRMDGNIFFKWIYQYANQRLEVIENLSIKQHEAFQVENISEPNKEGQKKVVEILKAAVPIENEYHVQKEVSKVIIPDERTKFIQACFNEFEQLYKLNPIQLQGTRFIKYGNANIDQVTFTEIKLKKYDNNHDNK